MTTHSQIGKSIQRETSIEATPEAVFAALSDADEVADWFAEDACIELRVCGTYHLLDSGGWSRGTITAMTENESITFTKWVFDDTREHRFETTVQFELHADGNSTRVEMSHHGFSDTPVQSATFWGIEKGWEFCLQRLKRYVETGSAGQGR